MEKGMTNHTITLVQMHNWTNFENDDHNSSSTCRLHQLHKEPYHHNSQPTLQFNIANSVGFFLFTIGLLGKGRKNSQ